MTSRNKKPLAIVILAAGKGTRMKSDTPKVMQNLAGLPMINWLIATAEKLEPEKIIVVVGPGMKDLEAAVKPHQTMLQDTRNGTGGAVRTALPALEGFDGDVLILLGDAPLIRLETLQNLIEARGHDLLTGLAVLGMELDDPFGYGRLVCDKQGFVQKIIEERDAGAAEKKITLVNAGAFCVDGKQLPDWAAQLTDNNAQKEFYITQLPEIITAQGGQVAACVTGNPEEVQGCNTWIELAHMQQAAQHVLRLRHMENGVHMTDPASVYFHHDTSVAPGVQIEPNVFFGPGVNVGAGAKIKGFSHIEGAQIGAGAQIGPFARIRPGSEIGEEVRIGNFVEIKKSTVGARSKINHLSYVGDTTMGDDVNFSAGAITVNYDGFEKHRTIIGDGVMVGSNVNLVAPLTIDNGAFVAAGSTITKDVPADSLSISRDVAQVREGWAAEYRKRKAAIAKKLKKKKSSS